MGKRPAASAGTEFAAVDESEAVPFADPSVQEGDNKNIQDQQPEYDVSTWRGIRKAIDDGMHEYELCELVESHVVDILNKYNLNEYFPLFLFDEDPISDFHATSLYEAAAVNDKSKDILLIVENNGGAIDPAYLLSKALGRLARSKFSVVVPRRAKSAATLLALGADEIHMGLMSQLGPVDPQIGGYPALALGNAVQVLAKLATSDATATMIAEYLKKNLSITDLGLFERVTESAVQYAERLLARKTLPGGSAEHVAKHFVYYYKDHGFAIDVDEAVQWLGTDTVKVDTPEYRAAREIASVLYSLGLVLRNKRKKKFWWVGGAGSITVVDRDR